jgi:hypothetical protein
MPFTNTIGDRLESNALTFQSLLRSVTDSQAIWRPAPDKWSLLEVTNHLADEEVEDFGTRLRLILEDPGQPWPPIDPERAAVERRYNSRELSESLARFNGARAENLLWLRGLSNPDWNVANVRPDGSTLRAGDLLHSWVAHDFIHIRQMNRLHYEHLLAKDAGFSPAYAGKW